MTIKVGDRLPDATFRIMTEDGVQTKSTGDIFKGKEGSAVRRARRLHRHLS